jgi:GNAT superfamily N-acetyltransferase
MRRDYAGPADLDDLLRFTQRIWSLNSRFHVGDIAWDFGLTPQADPALPMSLWSEDGEVAAWGVLGRGTMSLLVDPARPELAEAVLDWGRALHGGDPEVVVLDQEKHLVHHLLGEGYTADPAGAFFLAHHLDLTDLPPVPDLPEGITIRPVRGEEDFAARVQVHRDVWAPSTFSEVHYRSMISRWPYRAEFDQVVAGPDGRFVAYVLGWYDEANRVGEFEPVGTVAEHRRQGLSRAVSLSVLHAFRAAGGTTALVYSRGDEGYPIPKQVYGALGFRPHARTVTYKPASAAA